ncbi:putative protein OS=Leifsonia shinshuensis OX=150026 GN=HNR13_002371 PE=4 SV=1 [Leifsonia shinshuensis]
MYARLASITIMDNGFGGMAILLWLSPLIALILVLGTVLIVPPVIAGVLTALASVMLRVVPKPRRAAEPAASQLDPWTLLVTLGRASGEPAEADRPDASAAEG